MTPRQHRRSLANAAADAINADGAYTATVWVSSNWASGDTHRRLMRVRVRLNGSSVGCIGILAKGGYNTKTILAGHKAAIRQMLPPVANFLSDTAASPQVDFTDQSTVSVGEIISWAWDFGDTNTSTSQNPSHTYGGAGTYAVTLIVTDDHVPARDGTVSQDVVIP